MLLKITGQVGSTPLREESEKSQKRITGPEPHSEIKNPATFQRHSRPLPFSWFTRYAVAQIHIAYTYSASLLALIC